MSALTWPVRFVRDVPRSRPTRVVLRNKGYVLWWARDEIRCALDACPHRATRLSGGKTDGDRLTCSYHDWSFDEHGSCVSIPQVPGGVPYPKACNLRTVPVTVSDGIVWLSDGDGSRQPTGTPTSVLGTLGPHDICTDKMMSMNNSYRLQIENTLDVAHLHTVHDGFQGSRALIGPVKCTAFYEDEDVLFSIFRHDSETPDVELVMLKPGTVIARVLDKPTGRLMRTNIINAAPETDSTCVVLFRDIHHHNAGLPADPSIFGFVNSLVISEIFKQDIGALAHQQANADLGLPYCMPAEADRAIAAFRRWYHRVDI
jgi:hypothetical protein